MSIDKALLDDETNTCIHDIIHDSTDKMSALDAEHLAYDRAVFRRV